MKHVRFAAIVLALFIPASASATELDRFLGEIDVRASADLGIFRADLSATFGVSSDEVDGLFEIFNRPADIYITLRIGELSDVPIERVVNRYQANKGQGWGVIAKSLGIKPGSAEFHALKKGRLSGWTRNSSTDKPGKSKGKGRY